MFPSGPLVRFGDGLEIPLDWLVRHILQVWTQDPKKGVEEIIPPAVWRIHEVADFLSKVPTAELDFMANHGRRWKASEGINFSTLPQVPEVVFDPADLEVSCQELRNQFEGIRFPAKDATLERYVRECHRFVARETRRSRRAIRATGQGLIMRPYKRFAGKALVFVGWEVAFLGRYIDARSKKHTAEKAERLALGRKKV